MISHGGRDDLERSVLVSKVNCHLLPFELRVQPKPTILVHR
jgi:hypothetical protein